LMDSELSSVSDVKAINQGLTTTSTPTFADLTISDDLVMNGSTSAIKFEGVHGGGSTGITYEDSDGDDRFGLLFESDEVILTNRHEYGSVVIKSSDSTGGSGNENTHVTFNHYNDKLDETRMRITSQTASFANKIELDNSTLDLYNSTFSCSNTIDGPVRDNSKSTKSASVNPCV